MSTCYKIFFAFLFLAVSGSSNAALITLNGTDVSFTYDNNLTGLYGTPIVAGDKLSFLTGTFQALSKGIAEDETAVSSNFLVTIDALPGKSIISTSLLQNGTYSRYGSTAEVALDGSIQLSTEADGTLPLSSIAPLAELTPTPRFKSDNWESFNSIDLSNTASVKALLDNSLFADTVASRNYARISLTGINLEVTTVANAIPLPQAVWLFGGGLMGLLSMSKRKKLL
jgi:hypothetical protein